MYGESVTGQASALFCLGVLGHKKTIENSMAVILCITQSVYKYYCAALSCAASLDTFLEAAFLWIVPLDANCMIFF